MRTVYDKCRDDLDGREDQVVGQSSPQVVGKSSPTKQPWREKQEDAYYFGHVPQNIVSRRLGIRPFYTSKSYPDPCAPKGVNEV